MNNSIRWPLLAMVLGFCAAYALWGQRRAGAPGGDPAPPPATAAEQNPTQKAHPTEMGDTPKRPKAEHGPTALKFNPDFAEFGVVPVNESRAMSIQVTNPTNKVIKLSDFRPSCGCLQTTASDFVLEPGATKPIPLSVAALAGSRKESVILFFMTDEGPKKEICKIDAHIKVLEEINVEPNVLRFDILEKNEAKTLESIVRSTDGKPFKIRTIACTKPEFTFKIEPMENGAAYKVLATLKGTKGGLVSESAGVVTDRERAGTVPLHVSGTINPDLSCQPATALAQADDKRIVGVLTTVLKRKSPGKLEVLNVVEAGQGAANQPITYVVDRLDEGSCRLSITFKNPYPVNVAPFGQFLVKTNVEEEDFKLPYRVNGLPLPKPLPKP